MSKMRFFAVSATFGGKILWKSIMEGTYIKKNTYRSGWGGKIAKFGPKIAFLAVLEPQDTIFSLFCTFW